MTESINALPEKLELLQLESIEFVSMVPQTQAWYVLGGVTITAILITLWKRKQRFEQSLWKREALGLADIALTQGSADTWFSLIKRVYLVHHTRSDLNALSDVELLGSIHGLPESLTSTILKYHYQEKTRLSQQDSQRLHASFTAWVIALPLTREENCHV
ncbi:DUF4381 family protein [uncultured Vibrio sp.]|uniref:DUF4381 family protein n=1 Tax=uncultured Vibrio sp. TaxID=114054 RepID=UPI0025DA88DD|nr:DUF4381 family protein [uncultured Vibrio sp.]